MGTASASTAWSARLLVILAIARPSGSALIQPAPSRPKLSSTHAVVTRRGAILTALPLIAAASAKPAHAGGYGPSGAASNSPAPLIDLDVEQWLKLNEEKLEQRLGSISSGRVQELIGELSSALDEAKLAKDQARIKQIEDQLSDVGNAASAAGVNRTQLDQQRRVLEAEIAGLQVRLKQRVRLVELDKQLKERERRAAVLASQPAWVVYGCAALASVGSTVIMHPVDTFKTLQQTGAIESSSSSSSKGQVKGSSRSKANAKGTGRRSSKGQAAAAQRAAVGGGGLPFGPSLGPSFGSFEAFGVIIPPLSELYVGLLPNIAKEAPSSALYLGIYEVVRAQLNGAGGAFEEAPLVGYLLAGAVGELAGSVVRAPSEACKTRVQSGVASSATEALRQVLFDERGRANTATAWLSSILRDVPMGAVQIAIFESLKAFLVQSADFDFDVNTLQAEAVLGALGGFAGSVLTTPADVVTTQIMTRSESKDGSALPGPLDVARAVYEQQGAAGFFTGLSSRGLYWAPAIGIFLSLYCSLRQLAAGLP